MKKCSLLFACCLAAAVLSAQTRKTWDAVYRSDLPRLDGVLSDTCWQALPFIGEFVTSTPVFGETPQCRTEVRLFYNETALYVAAHCYDPDARGVRRDAGIRDGEPTGDWFRVSIDTWNDDQLSFDFTVTPAGVQQDIRDGANWNANWQSAVALQADGWTLEIRIPYTALRYPKKAQQNWGIQFTRFDRSRGETSTWSPQDPLVRDRVLQFGTLGGVQDIHRERRHALALHTSSRLEVTSEPLRESALSQVAGIDARLGVSESATLDFTVLPPLAISTGSSLITTPGSSDHFAGNALLPEPRQLQEEESGLFGRGYRALTLNPIIHPLQMTWRRPLIPGTEFFTEYSESKLLNAVKFTGRTKGNWRLGAYHALLGPVKAKIININDFENRETVQFQNLSSYSFVTGEYILPNNSFLNFSNATLLAGPNMHSVLPSLDFRLRNRTNNLELSGNSTLTYQEADTLKQRGYGYALTLSRINRRWGWSLGHRANSREYNDNVSALPFFTADARNGSSTAEVNYRDFRPRGPWLNRSGRAGLSVRWGARPGEQDVWTLSAGIGVLDKGFRAFTAGLSLIPHEQVYRYESGGGAISQKVAPRAGINLAFSTDERRRFRLNTVFDGQIGVEGKFPSVYLAAEPLWVINRWLTLQSRLWTSGRMDELVLLPASGQWIFEQHDFWFGGGDLELSWYPVQNLRVFGSLGVHFNQYAERETLELLQSGDFVPVNHPLAPFLYSYDDWEGSLGLQFVISPLSQIRLRHRVSPNQPGSLVTPIFSFRPDYSSQTEVNFIYTLGGGGRG